MEGLTLQQLQYFLPEIILVTFGLVVILISSRNKESNLHFFLTISALVGALIVTISQLGTDVIFSFGTIEINTFSLLLKIFFIILGILTVWASKDFANTIAFAKEYYGLILFATVGLTMVGTAGDLITLFIAFELTSISTYALPLIDKKNEHGKEAAVKYFITGAFATGLVLFGLSLLYGLTGTVLLKDMAPILLEGGSQPLLVVSFALIVAGFGYKMTLVPFHLWAPDVYEGSPTPVTSFLAAATKKGAFVVALKIFITTLVAIKLQVSILLAIIAVITMTVGNAVALMQNNTKRMLAYSSVAHAGNILVGLAIITELAVAGAILHIIAHGLMTIGIFFGILYVAEKRGGYDLEHFAGLRTVAPWTAFGLFLMLLSLAGVPPFVGFWSKMVIVVSAFELGSWYIYLALALVLNSALSLVYYARVIKVMYMAKDVEVAVPTQITVDTGRDYTAATIEPGARGERGSYIMVLYACAILITLTGFFPEQLVAISREAARFIIP